MAGAAAGPGPAQLGEDAKGNVAALWVGTNGRVLDADRPYPPGDPAAVTLSKNQLLINQRISQFAVRQANALRTRLTAGLTGQDIVDGGFSARVFQPQVVLAGAENGAFLPPNAGRPVPLPPVQPGNPDQVTLSQDQLLINQRISQAAVRRANAVQALLAGGLTGGDVVNGALGASKLAPLLRVLSATPGASPAPGSAALAAADQAQPKGNPAAVTLEQEPAAHQPAHLAGRGAPHHGAAGPARRRARSAELPERHHRPGRPGAGRLRATRGAGPGGRSRPARRAGGPTPGPGASRPPWG